MNNKLLVLCVLTLFFSCEKKPNNTFQIEISPKESHFFLQNTSQLSFNININSPSSINNVRILESIDGLSNNVVFDSTNISSNNFNFWFDYNVPEKLNYGLNEIQLTFSSTNNSGDIVNRAKIIYIDFESRLLEEFAGNIIYSCESDNFDALNLLSGQPSYNFDTINYNDEINNINENIHIADWCDTIQNTLSSCWYSKPEIFFVRYNSFDYANASNQTVKSVYESGVKVSKLCNLQVDDIILTMVNNSPVAIKLIYIIDGDDNNLDRYIFNIKR